MSLHATCVCFMVARVGGWAPNLSPLVTLGTNSVFWIWWKYEILMRSGLQCPHSGSLFLKCRNIYSLHQFWTLERLLYVQTQGALKRNTFESRRAPKGWRLWGGKGPHPIDFVAITSGISQAYPFWCQEPLEADWQCMAEDFWDPRVVDTCQKRSYQ